MSLLQKVTAANETKSEFKLNVMHAMHMIAASCPMQQVQQQTTVNCFGEAELTATRRRLEVSVV
jgi:hypothetical protein